MGPIYLPHAPGIVLLAEFEKKMMFLPPFNNQKISHKDNDIWLIWKIIWLGETVPKALEWKYQQTLSCGFPIRQVTPSQLPGP